MIYIKIERFYKPTLGDTNLTHILKCMAHAIRVSLLSIIGPSLYMTHQRSQCFVAIENKKFEHRFHSTFSSTMSHCTFAKHGISTPPT